jgi:hypothetical protein
MFDYSLTSEVKETNHYSMWVSSRFRFCVDREIRDSCIRTLVC